jgi:pheromone shutdown-related protein TraB
MIKYNNLTLIGTSHIAKESIELVKSTFLEINPDIVAVELDKERLFLLLNPEKRKNSIKNIKQIGITGYIFNIIGAYIEKKLGKIIGTKPGDEMKIAILLAKEQNKQVALIDQNIKITLKKLNNEITWKEKFRLIFDILFAGFNKQKIKNIDLSKVPNKKIINELTKIVKKRYPSIHKVLIKERDIFLAKNLNKLMSDYPNKEILGIVGAGHEESIIDYLKNVQN